MDSLSSIRSVHGDAPELLPRSPLPLAPGQAVVSTETVLRESLSNRARGRQAAAIDGWAELFLRKFEVFKKLRASYGPNLRGVGSRGASDDSYALFAHLLALTPGLIEDLRTLNCLLKLLDTVCSLDPGRLSRDAAGAAAGAIRLEVSAVEALARRHRLPEV